MPLFLLPTRRMKGIYQARGNIQRHKQKSFRVWLKLKEEIHGFSHEKNWWSKYRGNSATVRTCVRGGALFQKGGIQNIFSTQRKWTYKHRKPWFKWQLFRNSKNPRGKLRTWRWGEPRQNWWRCMWVKYTRTAKCALFSSTHCRVTKVIQSVFSSYNRIKQELSNSNTPHSLLEIRIYRQPYWRMDWKDSVLHFMSKYYCTENTHQIP